MKKIYIQPTTNAVSIVIPQLLNVSFSEDNHRGNVDIYDDDDDFPDEAW